MAREGRGGRGHEGTRGRDGAMTMAASGKETAGEEWSFLRRADLDRPYDRTVQIRGDRKKFYYGSD